MSLPITSEEEQRLKIRLENATTLTQQAGERSEKAGIETAKEKTQYFEKIALANAGTIALVVSFVGAHASRLQPRWLLGSALVALFVAMILSMYRNWKYPYYLAATHDALVRNAVLEQERCHLAYIVAVRPLNIKDGEPIDIEDCKAKFVEKEKLLSDQIEKSLKKKTAMFKWRMLL